MGFKNSSVDRCINILYKRKIEKNVYIILYVDDVIIVTKDIIEMNRIKECLMMKFKMTD